MKDLIYLASPYSTPIVSGFSIQERYRLTKLATLELIKQGFSVWSPIVHCHKLAEIGDLPKDAQFWQEYNYAFVARCSCIFVLMLEGWRKSLGVVMEIKWADELGKSVYYVDPVTYKNSKYNVPSPISDDDVTFKVVSAQRPAYSVGQYVKLQAGFAMGKIVDMRFVDGNYIYKVMFEDGPCNLREDLLTV